MTMFRALAPSLTIWAANPRALRIVLLDKSLQPQDLTGRTATLSIRRSAMLDPRVTVESVMSTDGYAWLFLLTADQCDLLYADGQAYSLSYDVIETRAGGSLRWTGRIDAQPASELPDGGAVPVLVDLPVAELVSETDTILISERGAAGFGVEQRLKDLGRIDEATPEAMDGYIRGLGEDAAAPYAASALEARDTALIAAGRSSDAQQLAEAAAQTALFGNVYADAAAGAAATPDGEEFVAYGPAGSYATRYLMVAGAPVAQDSYPNRSALDAQAQAVQRTEQSKSADRPMHSLENATGMAVADFYERGSALPGLSAGAPPDRDEPFEEGISGLYTASGFRQIAVDDDGWWLPGGARMESGPKGVKIIQRDGSVALGGSDAASVADITPICGGDLALVSDRPLPFHVPALFKVRDDDEPAIVTIASRRGLPATGTIVSASGGTILLDPAKIGAATAITIRRKGDRGSYLTRTLTSRVKQVPVSGSPPITLFVQGDSITNRQTALFIKSLLEYWGYAPSFVGTMLGDGSGSTSGVLGEGREGWAFQDWLGIEQDSDWTDVVPTGGEAAYLAMANADKLRWHPALNSNLASGSQCPIVTVGGVQYRYDFAFYLARFSLATPTCFVINLGMNDLLEKTAETSLAQVISGYTYLLDEYRRVAPTAKIVLWATDMPSSALGDANWSEWAAILAAIEKIVRDRQTAGDANIRLCSAWLHQSPEPGGWTASASAIDAATGFATATITDGVHPIGIGRDQQFEAVAAVIANFF